MEFSRIKYSAAHRVGRIVLSRPDQGNALDDQMAAELLQAFTQIQRNSDVKTALLSAEGETFCTGLDPAYLQKIAAFDFNRNLEDSTNVTRLFVQMYTLRKPIIALVNGPALAAGCGLAAVSDFVLAARETAQFGFPEVRSGLVPAITLPFLVRRIGEGQARILALRGTTISAEAAVQIGLASKAIPAMELDKAGKELAEELVTQNSASSMGLIKELLARMHGMATTEATEYAANLDALARMTDDCKKGIESAIKNESLRW